MKCNRCGSMMAYEKFYYETEQFWGWRCIFCGEYIDRVIWENRQYQKTIGENNRRAHGHLGGGQIVVHKK